MLCPFNRIVVLWFFHVLAPLHLLVAQHFEFQWTEERKQTFRMLMQMMTSLHALAVPSMKRIFHVYADVSKDEVDDVLLQHETCRKLRAVQSASRSIVRAERMYYNFEREAIAIVYALKKFRYYLLAGPFVVCQDCYALRAAFGNDDADGRLARWHDQTPDYQFEIQHVDGN